MKTIGYWPVVALSWAGLLSSCDSRDPGLEEEVSRLRQEISELRGKLESADQAGREASARFSKQTAGMREQVETARAALKEMESRFDRKRLDHSFGLAILDLKQEALKKFPGSTISQVKLHQMVMPSDHPFSSGVTLVLNDSAGTSRTIHVKALGNLEGVWSFEKMDADVIAANRPEIGPPPATPPADQEATSPQAPEVPQTSSNDGDDGDGAERVPKPIIVDWGD